MSRGIDVPYEYLYRIDLRVFLPVSLNQSYTDQRTEGVMFVFTFLSNSRDSFNGTRRDVMILKSFFYNDFTRLWTLDDNYSLQSPSLLNHRYRDVRST